MTNIPETVNMEAMQLKIPSCVIRNIESFKIRETKVPEIRKSITLFPIVMRQFNLRFFKFDLFGYDIRHH